MDCVAALSVFGLQQLPATEADLGKIYRRKAKMCHPDKSTGSEDEFKTLQTAMDVLASYYKPKPLPSTSLWSKGKARQRMKIRGSVGQSTIYGTYLKASTGDIAEIAQKDGRPTVVDHQFRGQNIEIAVDTYNGSLRYFNVDGQVEVNEECDSFISWTNGNVWFKVPDVDLGHDLTCACQGCRLYKELRYKS
jgi:hypothetical protein